jgi:hypothetical protein
MVGEEFVEAATESSKTKLGRCVSMVGTSKGPAEVELAQALRDRRRCDEHAEFRVYRVFWRNAGLPAAMTLIRASLGIGRVVTVLTAPWRHATGNRKTHASRTKRLGGKPRLQHLKNVTI